MLPGEAELGDRYGGARSGTAPKQHHVSQVPETCHKDMSQDKVCATAQQHKESKQQNSTPMK